MEKISLALHSIYYAVHSPICFLHTHPYHTHPLWAPTRLQSGPLRRGDSKISLCPPPLIGRGLGAPSSTSPWGAPMVWMMTYLVLLLRVSILLLRASKRLISWLDYDVVSFGAGGKSVPIQYNFNGQVPCSWRESPNSLGGPEEMSSASSSPATSNPSSTTSCDGPSFSNLQLFDLPIGASQSCPPSMTTSPVSPPLSEVSDSEHLFNYPFYLPPPMHTSSVSPSSASQISMSVTELTELLDNCPSIRQNAQAGTTFSPPLFPSSFQMNGHVSASTSGHHVPGDQCPDSGQVEYPNPMEPQPPDRDLHFTNWQIGYGFSLQAGDAQDSLLRPSSLTANDAGGCNDEQSLPRVRRCRSVPNLEPGTDSIPARTVHNRAPYHSRTGSRPRKCPEPQGYRDRVSTVAFRKVSDARRTAPAPHQCHICSDTFTRADGLQSKSWVLSGCLIMILTFFVDHIDRHTGQGKKTRCDFCDEERTTISRHMKTCAMNPNREPSSSKSPRSKKSCSPF